MNKVIEGLKQAVQVAECEHAMVLTPKQPSDQRYFRQFCPRCEGTFLTPKDDPSKHLRIIKA